MVAAHSEYTKTAPYIMVSSISGFHLNKVIVLKLLPGSGLETHRSGVLGALLWWGAPFGVHRQLDFRQVSPCRSF